MATRFARAWEPLYASWRENIFTFADEGLRFGHDMPWKGPTWQQREMMELVQLESYLPYEQRKRRITCKSGQGTGKSATTAAVIGLWRAMRDVDALVIITAPSMRQCKQDVDEIKRVLRNAHPLLQQFIEVFGTKVEINGSNIWGIRTATATRPQNLQGIHEKRLTCIVDEASGVDRKIIETLEGTLSNPDSLLVMIGNPNTTDCAFHDSFTLHADLWHRLTWNAEDTARDYPQLLSPGRNRLIEMEYGRDSDVYRVRVQGEFPHQNPNSIMALEDIVACTQTSAVGCSTIRNILPVSRAFGIDFARFGGDESVVVRRAGLAVVDYRPFVKTDPREVTDYAFRLQADAHWKNADCWYIPDAGGMGQGVMHAFYEAGKNVIEFNTQLVAMDSAMFADIYSEAWWNLRNLVKERIVHLPNCPRLIKQLSTRNYYTDRKGRIKVETKDEWRDRTVTDESPDRADALVMAFYSKAGLEARVAPIDRTPRRSR